MSNSEVGSALHAYSRLLILLNLMTSASTISYQNSCWDLWLVAANSHTYIHIQYRASCDWQEQAMHTFLEVMEYIRLGKGTGESQCRVFFICAISKRLIPLLHYCIEFFSAVSTVGMQ